MNIRKYSPLIVILFTVLVIQLVSHFKPEAKKKIAKKASVITVETMAVMPQQYQVVLNSYGKIKPRTRGVLSAQVSGQIIEINPHFREGGFFEKGEVLLTIDPSDYKVQVDIAQAELAEVGVAYEEQQALAEQALAEQGQEKWSALGRKGKASDFALRKPHLRAAQLKIDSARARLKQARLAVERTQIKAAYRGRVLEKHVDVGDVVSSMSKLAEIYAVDRLEIRLPLQNSELAFIDLPESKPLGQTGEISLPTVTIGNELGSGLQEWQANIVRTAGAIDEKSQQLYVTAQIEDPYGEASQDRRPLKIGQFVTARIEGRTLNDAIVIPNAAIYQGSYVYLVSDGLLQRTNVEIAWQNSEQAIISHGIKQGDQLVLTPLGQVNSGTRVTVSTESERDGQPRGDKKPNSTVAK